MRRSPLGDGTVNILGPEFTANGGVVEEGVGDWSGGRNFEGGRGFALSGMGTPVSPGVGELQVDPLNPDVNYSCYYPANGGETAWKGNTGKLDNPGFPRVHGEFPDEGFTR